VFYPRVKSWWAKALALLFPVATISVVMLTANHYWLDAVGGAVIFLVGYGAARLATRAGRTPKAGTPEAEAAKAAEAAEIGPGGGVAVSP
jgi:hypothetical protein